MSETRGNNTIKTKKMIYNKLALMLAEFIGTALLVFLGCMGCMVDVIHIPVVPHFPALTFGLAIMLIIQIFGHISGSHLNPVVTLAAVILELLDYVTAAYYVAGQFAGAILGFGLIKVLTPSKYNSYTEVVNQVTNSTYRTPGLCTTLPHDEITSMQALTLETIITTILILICAAVWDKRNSSNTDSTPLRFGLAISALAMTVGPYTGASMNPARSLAPALFNNYWQDHWVYWLGPLMGGIQGAMLYKYAFTLPNDEIEEITELEELKSDNNVNKT